MIILNEDFVVSTWAISDYMMEDFCEVSGKEKMTYVNKVSGWRGFAPSTLWIEGVSSISSEIKSQLMPTFIYFIKNICSMFLTLSNGTNNNFKPIQAFFALHRLWNLQKVTQFSISS